MCLQSALPDGSVIFWWNNGRLTKSNMRQDAGCGHSLPNLQNRLIRPKFISGNWRENMISLRFNQIS